MSLLSGVKQPENLEKEKDTLGGFQLLSTDVYDATIKLAYLTKAKSGAVGLVTHFDIAGSEIRHTEYFKSGDEKGNKTTFTKNGEEFPLPGYTFSNNLCLLTVGKNLTDLGEETEMKTINLYNGKEGKELPTEVEVLAPVMGEKIAIAVEHQLVNKQVKGDNGKYVDTNESREQNVVTQLFHIDDRRTAPEMRNEIEKAEFVDMWLEKNQGNVIDKFKAVSNAPSTGSPTGGSAASSNESASSSVFGKKA